MLLKILTTKTILDVIILFFGAYVFYLSISMKKKNKISTVLISEEEIQKCRSEDSFILYMFPRLNVFGVLLEISGIWGLICDFVLTNTYFELIELVIFLAGFFLFYNQLHYARTHFLYD